MLVKNKTYRFRLNALKDGVPWDITGATVTLFLRKPNGSELVKSATIEEPLTGLASYTTVAGDLDTVGTWRRSWQVVQGTIDVESPKDIPFVVKESP